MTNQHNFKTSTTDLTKPWLIKKKEKNFVYMRNCVLMFYSKCSSVGMPPRVERSCFENMLMTHETAINKQKNTG